MAVGFYRFGSWFRFPLALCGVAFSSAGAPALASQPERAQRKLIIPLPRLERLSNRMFVGMGTSDDKIQVIVEHLVRKADAAKHPSHGTGMIPRYVDEFQLGHLDPQAEFSLDHDQEMFFGGSGNAGHGHFVAMQMAEMAVERVQKHGAVFGWIKGAHHIGRLMPLLEKFTEVKMAVLAFANTDGELLVAPHGGTQGRFLTNPVGIGFPGDPPLLYDGATSLIAQGKVRHAKEQGLQVAEGLLVDADGHPTTDPNVMFQTPRGALLPGNHKQGAWLYAAEMSAKLTGSPTSDETHGNPQGEQGDGKPRPIRNSVLLIGFDPQKVNPMVDFFVGVSEVAAWAKTARVARDAEFGEILIPGERSRRNLEIAEREGVQVAVGSYDLLLAAGAKLGISADELNEIAGVTAADLK